MATSKIRYLTVLVGAALMGIGLASAFAVYVAPFIWTVKTDAFKNWWIYFIPGIPFTFGVWMLFKAEQWADSTMTAAETIAEKIEEHKK